MKPSVDQQVYTLSFRRDLLIQSWIFMRIYSKNHRTFALEFLQDVTLVLI